MFLDQFDNKWIKYDFSYIISMLISIIFCFLLSSEKKWHTVLYPLIKLVSAVHLLKCHHYACNVIFSLLHLCAVIFVRAYFELILSSLPQTSCFISFFSLPFPIFIRGYADTPACPDLFDFFLVRSSSLSSLAALSFNSLSFKMNCILKSPLSFSHLCTPTSKTFSLYPFTFSLLCLLGKCILRIFIALLSASDIVEEK